MKCQHELYVSDSDSSTQTARDSDPESSKGVVCGEPLAVIPHLIWVYLASYSEDTWDTRCDAQERESFSVRGSPSQCAKSPCPVSLWGMHCIPGSESSLFEYPNKPFEHIVCPCPCPWNFQGEVFRIPTRE